MLLPIDGLLIAYCSLIAYSAALLFAPPWAAAAAIVGPGGAEGGIDWGGDTSEDYTKPPTDYTKPRQTVQSPDRLYEAPAKYTKPQQTICKDPNRLYKSPTDYAKPLKDYTKT